MYVANYGQPLKRVRKRSINPTPGKERKCNIMKPQKAETEWNTKVV